MANPSFQEIVDAYGEAWVTPVGQKRIECLQKSWADDGVYVDPTVEVVGREALAAHIAAFQARFPGSRIVLTSQADEHHGKLRFAWEIIGEDGATVSVGIDFGELAEDGRLRRIVGFFGPVRPLEQK